MGRAAVAIFAARVPVVAVSLAAFVCTFRAQEIRFSALLFLKGSLLLLVLWNALRLFYDAAQVFFHAALPADPVLFFVLVLVEWVATAVLFTAVSCSTAVLVFFRIDTMACGQVSPGPRACSHWYVAAAALTLAAWFFNFIITILISFVFVASIEHML